MAAIHLVQFTDPHLQADPRATLRGIATLPALRDAVEHARRGAWPPDAVLATGDLVQDDPGGYVSFRGVFDALGVPVLCLPGNHDDGAALRTALAAAPYQVCGHRDFGAWRIVLLDTAVPGSAAGRLADPTLEALEHALAGAGERHVLICLHHQPVPMGSRWLDAVGLENPEALFARIGGDTRVRALLWGHVHQAFDAQRGGVRLLATPSTCAQFLPRSDEFAIDTRPPGYRTLCLHDDGRIDTKIEWVTHDR